MSLTEEVIEAVIEPDGTLRLSHQPQLPPGPVRVTVSSLFPQPQRGVADVTRNCSGTTSPRVSRQNG
jgi:hypothetical protein